VDIDIDRLPSRLKNLEKEGFHDFSRAFDLRLRRFFLRLGSCAADAESLAVSCIDDIPLKVDRFRDEGPGSFEAWVYQVARNAWTDEQRAWRGRPLPPDLPDQPTRQSDPGLVEDVERALASLHEGDRSIIFARYFDIEKSFAEIGEAHGMTENAARQRHYRAINRLNVLLAARRPVDSGAAANDAASDRVR
jgi:RNA polymerase sigma factor (sigma-70 family)